MNILQRYSILFLFVTIIGVACTNNKDKQANDTTVNNLDSSDPVFDPHSHTGDTIDVYHNETFKNVVLKKTGETTYEVTGQARVFEATYRYVVKDGNETVTDGHGTTDAGAPAFGKFSFTVDVRKKIATEGMYLILFEASAKDGSMIHELPIPIAERR